MNNPTYCPKCGTLVKRYSNPTPTADVVIYDEKRGIVLVRRSNEPLGLALPGGFVEEGESVEELLLRLHALEERVQEQAKAAGNNNEE